MPKTTAQIIRDTLDEDDGSPDCLSYEDEITKWHSEAELETEVYKRLKKRVKDGFTREEIIKVIDEIGCYGCDMLKKKLGLK